jgi:hypothetical protein
VLSGARSISSTLSMRSAAFVLFMFRAPFVGGRSARLSGSANDNSQLSLAQDKMREK